jgi:hypothetical protein
MVPHEFGFVLQKTPFHATIAQTDRIRNASPLVTFLPFVTTRETKTFSVAWG